MRPFNLEEALAGKPVQTRDGRKVTEIYHFKTANNSNYPVTAIIDGKKYSSTIDGLMVVNNETDIDLYMAPESIDVWVNVWRSDQGKYFTKAHESEVIANTHSQYSDPHTFIKTEKITINI